VAEGRWVCGTLGRAHGLTGELYLDLAPRGLDCLTRGEDFFLATEGVDGLAPVRLRRTGGTDRRPLVRLDEVDTRDAALAVQGAVVLAASPALDEGDTWAVSELLGRRVLAGERELGVVDDVVMGAAQDILQIRRPDGGVELVPFVAELVSVDDDAGGVIRVREGLL
jgi:16S rRNA processing protein RimM